MTREEFAERTEEKWCHSYDEEEMDILEENDFCCENCGDGIDDLDEHLNLNCLKRTVLCDNCLEESLINCAWCEYGFEETTRPEDDRVLVNKELAKMEGIKPGIYQVLEYPYYMQSILGNGFSLFKSAIRLIAEGEVDAEISGPICDECFQNGCDGQIQFTPAKSMEMGKRYGHAPSFFYKESRKHKRNQ